MPDGQNNPYNLSDKDRRDLTAIRSKLPQGDPRRTKIDRLVGPEATVGATPSPWSAPGMKSAALTARDKLIQYLPTIGGTVGGLLGASAGGGVASAGTAALGAAAGGAGGEDLRQSLTEYFHPEDRRMTAGESARGIGGQAVEQGVSELGGRGLGKVFAPSAEKTAAHLYYAGQLGPREDLEAVLPEIRATEKGAPAKTVDDFIQVVGQAKKKIGDEVDAAMKAPVVAGGKSVPLGDMEGDSVPIANRIETLIAQHPSDVEMSPVRIRAIQERANKYVMKNPNGRVTEIRPHTYAWLTDRREVLNKELNSFYALITPADKAQYLAAHPNFEIDKAEADAIRDVIYPKMDRAAGKPAGYFETLQKKRGALIGIENQTKRNLATLRTKTKIARGGPPMERAHAYATSGGKIGMTTRMASLLKSPNVEKPANKAVAQAFGHTPTANVARALGLGTPAGAEVMAFPLRMLFNPDQPEPEEVPMPDSSNSGQQ